jgi:uncharacterized membrane protein YjfL (UPF0719 family)
MLQRRVDEKRGCIMDIDWIGIGHSAAFLLATLLIVFVGKLLRDALARLRGHDVDASITLHDHAASAIDQSAFLLAVALGVIGSLVLRAESLLDQALEAASLGAVVVASLLVQDVIAEKLIFRGIDNASALHKRNNVALALGRAGNALATAFVLRGALDHDSALLDRVAWVLIGQVALVAIAWLYQKLTPYDDLKEIAHGNVAAALPIAGILLAVGITVEAALRGQGEGWLADLLSVGLDLALSLVLIQALRWLADLVLLPGTTLAQEIERDKNVGAGVTEAASFVVAALLVAHFVN